MSEFDTLGIPDIWKKTRGEGISIAVIDSGVKLVDGLSQGRVTCRDLEGKIVHAWDSSVDGHGTKVTAIVASDSRAVTGVAPGATVMCFDVYDTAGKGPLATKVEQALNAAIELGADVICCPFTLPQLTKDLESVLARAREKGIPVVVAEGNAHDELPGRAPSVLSVAGWKDGALLPSSHTKSSIAAPGAGISTRGRNGKIVTNFEGTSAASPFIAGTIALAFSFVRDKPIKDQIRARIHTLLHESVEYKIDKIPCVAPARLFKKIEEQ